jgi:DnaJ-like protein
VQPFRAAPWQNRIVSLARIAENKIREAIARGEFDHLVGAGRPIDLEEYFRTPEDLRMAYSVLKSARCLPQEVELMTEIAALDRDLGGAPTEQERARLRRLVRDRRLQLSMALDRQRARTRSCG